MRSRKLAIGEVLREGDTVLTLVKKVSGEITRRYKSIPSRLVGKSVSIDIFRRFENTKYSWRNAEPRR